MSAEANLDSRRGRRRSGTGTSPEAVLLQIVLGFVAIMGYLLTQSREHQASLAQEMQRALVAFDDLVAKDRGTLIEEAETARIAEEKQRLLNAWLRRRESKRLFRSLALAIERLPTYTHRESNMGGGEAFLESLDYKELRAELDRLFRGEAKHNRRALNAEVLTDMKASADKVGFRFPPVQSILTAADHAASLEILLKHADSLDGTLNRANMDFLATVIASDYFGAEKHVSELQLAILLELMDNDEEMVDGNDADTIAIRRALVDRYDQTIGLLPSTRRILERVQ